MHTVTSYERALWRSCGKPPRDEARYREGLRAHEPSALLRLFDTWFDSIHARARCLCPNARAAELLTQDVFRRIRARLDELEAGEPVAPWVESIVSARLLRHRLRRRGPRDLARRPSSRRPLLRASPRHS